MRFISFSILFAVFAILFHGVASVDAPAQHLERARASLRMSEHSRLQALVSSADSDDPAPRPPPPRAPPRPLHLIPPKHAVNHDALKHKQATWSLENSERSRSLAEVSSGKEREKHDKDRKLHEEDFLRYSQQKPIAPERLKEAEKSLRVSERYRLRARVARSEAKKATNQRAANLHKQLTLDHLGRTQSPEFIMDRIIEHQKEESSARRRAARTTSSTRKAEYIAKATESQDRAKRRRHELDSAYAPR
jgi:hypothetical protein